MKIGGGQSRKLVEPLELVHARHVVENNVSDHLHSAPVGLVDEVLQISFGAHPLDNRKVNRLVSGIPDRSRVGFLRWGDLDVGISLTGHFANIGLDKGEAVVEGVKDGNR